MRLRKLLILAPVILLILAFAYLCDCYRADSEKVSEYIESAVAEDGYIVTLPEDISENALIFYPGAKVEYSAYIPLMEELSERGIVCYLIKMPFNLALFDINAADKIVKEHKEIKHWHIAGHSLGGAMASIYAYKHQEAIASLILLASYSTKDISQSSIKVLSIYGSNDEVLKLEHYNSYKHNLPTGFKEEVIAGANHSGFAFYGPQKGDGVAAISKEEQVEAAADIISEFILSEN